MGAVLYSKIFISVKFKNQSNTVLNRQYKNTRILLRNIRKIPKNEVHVRLKFLLIAHHNPVKEIKTGCVQKI